MDRKRLVVIFRNDDLSARSDVMHERRIASLFDRYQIPQTIGVIPSCTTGSYRNHYHLQEAALAENPEIVKFLCEYVERSGSEIALHGYTHRTNEFSQPTRREFFEFRRISLEEQCRRIQQGTAIIHDALGIRPITFIPPWNRLDTNTLYACQQHGYKITSAGMFTPTLPGLYSLGTNCGLDTFPTVFATAQTGTEQIFLRVLFHSAMIRTETEMAELEQAVALVAQAEDCEVLTLCEAVRRYPEEVQCANEAARNVVSQDEVARSSRARAVVYRRAFHSVGLKPEVEQIYADAATLCAQGRYSEVCSLSSKIELTCERLLMTGRSAAVGLGGILAICGMLTGNLIIGLDRIVGALIAIVLASGSGAFLYWKATAPDTKQEICIAVQAVLVGAALSIGLLWGIASAL